ncbi:MAG: hypothetical protein IJ678_04385 [Kiritimatiellae bacterium]|nr:hypothetical protein [Kiritimatiellia bacterium]
MKLSAKTDVERRLLDYLDANASPELRAKIDALPDGDRFGLRAAWKFITDEARKKLSGKSGYLADEVVFGWLVHYYEDVAPAEAAKPAPAVGVNGNENKKASAKAVKPDRKQLRRSKPSPDEKTAKEKPGKPVPADPPAADVQVSAPTAEDSGFSFSLFEEEAGA